MFLDGTKCKICFVGLFSKRKLVLVVISFIREKDQTREVLAKGQTFYLIFGNLPYCQNIKLVMSCGCPSRTKTGETSSDDPSMQCGASCQLVWILLCFKKMSSIERGFIRSG